MSGNYVLASLVTALCSFSVYWTGLINHEAFQVLALTVASIVSVAVAAVVLICIPEYLNGRNTNANNTNRRRNNRGNNTGASRNRHNNNSSSNNNNNSKRNHRHRVRGRERVRERGRPRNRNSYYSSTNEERLNQNEYPLSSQLSSTLVESSSSVSASASESASASMPTQASASTSRSTSTSLVGMNSSRQKSPSMPPLPIRSRANNSSSNIDDSNAANYDNTPGRVPVSSTSSAQRSSKSPRRHSLPPSLPSQALTQNSNCLNPIVERKLEDLMDFDDYWWRELDSRTQYYALILGYTVAAWDEDLSLDDLPCEDWDWEDMTNEQKAAAQHFGYSQETWED